MNITFYRIIIAEKTRQIRNIKLQTRAYFRGKGVVAPSESVFKELIICEVPTYFKFF
jgi:hypothetical protein